MQEEAKPHALAAAFVADEIHPVVPVARSHQRQAMRAETVERPVDAARAVAEQRILVARRQRHGGLALLILGDGTGFEEGLDFVEDGVVSAPADIANRHIRQPQVRIRRMRAVREARAAIGRAMPPFAGVALDILMRGVQQNLSPGALRARDG